MEDTTIRHETTGAEDVHSELVLDEATQVVTSPFDQKIAANFPGVVVRKDLVKAVKGNAIVPTYVLEYLLGQFAATDDEATIRSGIESVRSVLRDHYVHRGDALLIQSKIREKGRHKVIDKVSVALNERDDVYEASFANLGINRVQITSEVAKKHPKLFTGGVWCICDIVYAHSGDPKEVPWRLQTLKPIQLSNLDLEDYKVKRSQFTTGEWIDLLIQSIGFNPELFGQRAKLLHLVRLIPFVERNYNLVELGPKGTGKSHIYSEFSPHGMLISGGEVTVAKLFVNNANGRIGLVGYWDCVAFDEFAGKKKRADRALVDIMKNYMANKSFSRGVETLGAEASMVFIGNTAHTVPYMLKNSDLFDELSDQYHDPAFLDRIHFYIPGWEFEQIRGEMFSSGYGFVVDYLAEVLKHQRDIDYSDRYEQFFELSSDISTRDRDGIHKTFSGLMKLVHPTGEATAEEMAELLQAAIEGRKRVKDQLIRIDTTMEPVKFGYLTSDREWHPITTLEEDEYPQLYRRDAVEPDADSLGIESFSNTGEEAKPTSEVAPGETEPTQPKEKPQPREGNFKVKEGRKGITYDRLFGPYLANATKIRVIDPYIRIPHQMRNLMEFIETVTKFTSREQEIKLTLVTKVDDDTELAKKQLENLEIIRTNSAVAGIDFDYSVDQNIHDRSIQVDTGWKIILGRGLDIFQTFDASWFDLRLRQQQFRQAKEFEITYVRQMG